MNNIMIEGNNTGFAVPINLIKIIAQILKTSGKVTRSWIGIEIADGKNLNNKMIKELDLSPSKTDYKNAIIVTKVISSSPAEKAGIKKGDIIKSYKFYDEKRVESTLDFVRSISYLQPGEIIYLFIERKDKILTIPVKLVLYPY